MKMEGGTRVSAGSKKQEAKLGPPQTTRFSVNCDKSSPLLSTPPRMAAWDENQHPPGTSWLGSAHQSCHSLLPTALSMPSRRLSITTPLGHAREPIFASAAQPCHNHASRIPLAL